MHTGKHISFKTATLAISAACLLFLGSAAAYGQTIKYSSRVLLIPLDDRPPCLQFPVKMGLVGDVEVVTPPREMLGRFTEFGRSDEIVEWIRKQNLKSFDAAIISVDMLAYGGLVASRVYETPSKDAVRRINVIAEMRRKEPKLKIYGSSVIMRLAPTANGKNEAYREKLAKWAEVSSDLTERQETQRLEKEIPADALRNYKLARERDLEINRYAVDLTKSRVFDYLILSQDDAKPRGVHVADRESLIEHVAANKLGGRVAIQPGADEVSMLLLSRAVTEEYNYHPKIKAIYSSEKTADQVMPFEDRPLRKTVSFHIKAAGGIEVFDAGQADILFYVYASRFEPDAASRFAALIGDAFRRENTPTAIPPMLDSKSFIVADIDPKGDVQGADPVFTEEVIKSSVFGSLTTGYASWNTAGNTIGTALPHGILAAAAWRKFNTTKSAPKAEFEKRHRVQRRIDEAQQWFLLHRLLDDYIYHSLVRPDAIKFSRAKGWSTRYDSEQVRLIERYSEPKVFTRAQEFLNLFAITRSGTCSSVQNRSFVLPWGRTFEAEIDFKLDCKRWRDQKNF